MAHFVELESKIDPTEFTSETHLIVKRIVVVANDIPVNGGTLENNDCHVDGETWCSNFFQGGVWKQTSYNNSFRKQYAGVGFRYDETKDKFIAPQPFSSWTLDTNDDWKAPISYPSETSNKYITWDEDNLRWIATSKSNSTNLYYWDADNTNWVDI
jgi:hypothetical protein